MKRLLATVALTAAVTAGASVEAPVAGAIPSGPDSCVMGGGPFATFRDCDLWADGSFWHEVYGGFIGYGGSAGRVCDGFPVPPPTDSNPNTPCPGAVLR